MEKKRTDDNQSSSHRADAMHCYEMRWMTDEMNTQNAHKYSETHTRRDWHLVDINNTQTLTHINQLC
jgi:hypothetical protein